jgi:hypothetical protein
MFSSFIMASSSSFRRILHNSFSFTGRFYICYTLFCLLFVLYFTYTPSLFSHCSEGTKGVTLYSDACRKVIAIHIPIPRDVRSKTLCLRMTLRPAYYRLLRYVQLLLSINKFISPPSSSFLSPLNSPKTPYRLWGPHETSCSVLTGDDFPAGKCAEASRYPLDMHSDSFTVTV